MGWYVGLVVAVAAERMVELVVARRNAAWSAVHGGIESGQRHYPFLVAVHVGLIAGCVIEPIVAHRTFLAEIGVPMLGLVLASQMLRWWCIGTLGKRWNTRIIVVPGLPLVTGGPYRWISHPNYVAVVVEGIALPLVASAWVTALIFTAVNLPLLMIRLRCESAALAL